MTANAKPATVLAADHPDALMAAWLDTMRRTFAGYGDAFETAWASRDGKALDALAFEVVGAAQDFARVIRAAKGAVTLGSELADGAAEKIAARPQRIKRAVEARAQQVATHGA